MSEGWKGGSTREQRRVRARVLARNRLEHGGRCEVGIPGVCTGSGQECVHHTLGKGLTGNDPRYQVGCCNRCNQHIGDPMEQPDPPAIPITKWA